MGFIACCCSCYRQARNCSNNTLANVWMTCTDAAMFPNAFSIGSNYYRFNFSDATYAAAGGTVYAASAAVARSGCPAPCTCPGGCTNYNIFFTAAVQIYDNSVPNCGGALLSTCGPMAGVGSVASVDPSACQWFFGGTTYPCNVGLFADPTLYLVKATPCSWCVQFVCSESGVGGDAQILTICTTIGTLPENAVFAPLTTCYQDSISGHWINVTFTITAIVCEDAP